MAHMAPIRPGLGHVRAELQGSGGCRVNSEFELVSLWLDAAADLEPDSRLCFNDTAELGGGKFSRPWTYLHTGSYLMPQTLLHMSVFSVCPSFGGSLLFSLDSVIVLIGANRFAGRIICCQV